MNLQCEYPAFGHGDAPRALPKTQPSTPPDEAQEHLHDRFGMLEFSHDAMIVRDLDGTILLWNSAAEAIYGWRREAAVGKKMAQLLGASASGHDEEVQAALVENGRWEGERIHVTRDGRKVLVASRQAVQRNRRGVAIAILECNHDISERRLHEDSMRSSARLLQSVMDSARSYIHVRGRRGEFLYVNQEYERVFGVSGHAIIGKTLEDVFPAEIAAMRRTMHETVLHGGVDLHAEIEQTLADGTHVYMDVKSPLFDENGVVYAVYCIGTDITERKAAEARVLQLAHYDAVTGLPNRALFLDRIEVTIAKTRRRGGKIALLYLDLDRFKEVNDTLGHGCGDLLLAEAGQRLRGCVRACDTVARIGGDEFTVIAEDIRAPLDVMAIAEKILEAIAEPFRIGGDVIYISASIGITMFPDDADCSVTLLKNADRAMYLSKSLGGNHFSFFTAAMHDAAASRLRIANDLRAACGKDEFSLVYQPVVALGSGRIYKAEALMRWRHPTRGMISPSEFIPICEETGLIMPIGDWVFREAACQCAAWQQQYDRNFEISINTSPAQYRNKGIDMDGWMRHMQHLRLPGHSITIEITEGLLMEASDAVREQLRCYREAGMQISLDDFGTGYSSLSYLRKFEVDYLKIDRAFVANLTPESDDLALCEAIVVMAHKLGIRVVAKGIEKALQRDLLLAAGCDYGQGYFFAQPLNPVDFEALLIAGNALQPAKRSQ